MCIMPYQLEVSEVFSAGIKRIAMEELSGALKGLRELDKNDSGAIHDARKRFKKTRAALRLVRSNLGRKPYRRANGLLRDAGRNLSRLRDAQVLGETLAALAKRFPEKSYQKAFGKVSQTLAARQQLATAEGQARAEEVAVKVAALEAQVTQLPVGDNWSSVEPNLSRTYGRGRKASKSAYRHPSDESFHEWRKSVKDLWYHLRILNPLWPKVIKELAAQASTLADLLGDEHDLAVLAQTLAAEPKAFGSAGEVEVILGLIEGRREALRSDARLLGQRLYADKPTAFSDRFGAYWQTWRAGVERQPQPERRPQVEKGTLASRPL